MNTVLRSPHIPIRQDWLSLHTEEIIAPTRQIIDAHHHLWDRPGSRYLFDEFNADLQSGHRIVASLYVQCRSMYRHDGVTEFKSIGEVEFANGIAAQFASDLYGPVRGCAGIIGYADLRLSDRLEPVLHRLHEAGGGRLKGIRNTTAWHPHSEIVSNPNPPPPGILLEPEFLKGVQELARHNLVLDVWAYHFQLSELYDMARACTQTLIVIDHIGGPIGIGPYQGESKLVFHDWSHSIQRLATLPNLRIKVGGFGLKTMGYRFHEQSTPPSSDQLSRAWMPYFDVLLSTFGADRCMFESNFPVDKGMFSYSVLWNTYKKLASTLSEDEQHALFYQTACDTYAIKL